MLRGADCVGPGAQLEEAGVLQSGRKELISGSQIKKRPKPIKKGGILVDPAATALAKL